MSSSKAVFVRPQDSQSEDVATLKAAVAHNKAAVAHVKTSIRVGLFVGLLVIAMVVAVLAIQTPGASHEVPRSSNLRELKAAISDPDPQTAKDIADLQAKIAATQTKMDALATQVNPVLDNVFDNTKAIVDHTKRIQANKDDVDTNIKDIQANKIGVDNNKKGLEAMVCPLHQQASCSPGVGCKCYTKDWVYTSGEEVGDIGMYTYATGMQKCEALGMRMCRKSDMDDYPVNLCACGWVFDWNTHAVFRMGVNNLKGCTRQGDGVYPLDNTGTFTGCTPSAITLSGVYCCKNGNYKGKPGF